MQYLVFGAIWLALMVVCFLIAGASDQHSRGILQKETGEINPRRTHQLLAENGNQLFLITNLLAGILAVLVAALLVK